MFLTTEQCAWSDVFEDWERSFLEAGLIYLGLLSMCLLMWLKTALNTDDLYNDLTYKNLHVYVTAAWTRRMLPLLIKVAYVLQCYIETWRGYRTFACEFFAYWETLLGVFEVECVVHICIERYVVAKYISNGWPIKMKHYYLFMGVSLLISCIHAYVPLLGLSRYAPDFACTYCTFDMVLPPSWQGKVVLAMFILRSIKPAAVMVIALVWCLALEKRVYKDTFKYKRQRIHTRNAIGITIMNLMCWTPIYLIRGWVLFSQILHDGELVKPAMFLIQCAMCLEWSSPMYTIAALVVLDDGIKHKMYHKVVSHFRDDKKEIIRKPLKGIKKIKI